MARFYWFILFSLAAFQFNATAQPLADSRTSSYYTFIYKISNEHAHELYRDMWNLENSYLKTLHDFYPTDSTYKKKLPTGHYLFVRAKDDDFTADLRSVNNLNVELLKNHRDLMAVFYDSTGTEIADAQIAIKRKNIPFDPKTKTYRLTKANKRGIVSAQYQGHTSFFEIERQHNNGFFVRTGRKISQTFIIRQLISPVVYLKNNIRNVVTGGSLYPPPFLNRLIRSNRYAYHYHGFIAFNKPNYKPADTVKLKAFLTNLKGRPLKQAVTVSLENQYDESAARKLATLRPFRPGAFTFEFKLTDSLKLQLDRNYTVKFTNKKGRTLQSDDFRFEDYELKNNNYTLRSEKENGKPTLLFLKGTDSNDMPLFDVRAEVVVRPTTVKSFYEPRLFVKDTLWFYKTKLESLGETKVTIPDSVMPNVSMEYEAVVSFLNSENERIVKTEELLFDKDQLMISLSLQNDSLVISPLPGYPYSQLRLQAKMKDKVRSEMISLPYKEKINHFAEQYSVTTQTKTKSLVVSDELDQLTILATRTKDSLFIATENPRKISFRYFLFRNQQLVRFGDNVNLSLKRKCNTNDRWSLSIQYVWAGESVTKEYTIPFDKKNLDIKIEHAPIVYPGENTPFTILVKDALGKPVENVDLTAYAVTKKFPNYNAPSVPNFSRQKSSRTLINQFSMRASETDLRKRIEYSYWRKILGLDSLTYYKFIFPDSGYFEDRSKSAITQFAPFVVGYGLEKVAVIYVDGQPVYYTGAQTIQPYSFAIKPGVHKIQLRLRNALLTLNDVRIASDEKLIFSVNRFKLPKNCTSVEMPYQLTEEELAKLSRYFVQVRWTVSNQEGYINQGDRFHVFESVSWNNSGNKPLVGPLYPGSATYFEKDGFQQVFEYAPFQTYHFKEKLLTMQQLDVRSILKDAGVGWYSDASLVLRDSVFTKQSVEAYWKSKEKLPTNQFRRFPELKNVTSRVGKLTIDYFGEHDIYLTKATFIVNLDDPDEYYVLPRMVKRERFNEGRYQAVIVLHDDRYIKADSIVVKPFGTNYYNILTKELNEADSFSTHILQLIKKWSSPENYLLRERERELERLRGLYYQETSANYAFTHTVTGRVTALDGSGLPGINVIVKGTAMGAVTDMEGYYSIKCPPDGQLVFSFIGFQSQEKLINNNGVINMEMVEDVTQLSEVVVVGYGVQRRQMLSSSVAYALSGKVAGVSINGVRPGLADSVSIKIRGITSVSGNQEPLVILDGRIVRLQDVNKALITEIEAITGADAVALYGSQAAGGVILMSTRSGATKAYLKEMSKGVMPVAVLEDVPGNALRKNFRDYAFWQPRLRTDENGKAVFRATFPDDITGWNAYVLGTATKRRTGQTSSGIQSYKPVVAQIAQPHFLIEGDNATALGKITNYGRDTLQLTRSISVNGSLLNEEVIRLRDSRIDSIALAPAGTDSLAVQYSVAFKNYKDGELRKIPVLRKGTLEANGQFFTLSNDTTLTLNVRNTNETLKLFAQADLLDVLTDEVRFLKDYVYECNEQLASKLKVLMVEKNICAYQKKKFTGDREVHKIIRKLASAQNDDGSWSWWKGGEGEVWVTLHALRALLKAESEGYKNAIDKERLINFMESKLSSVSISTRLDLMNFLAEQGQILKVEAVIDSIKSSTKTTVHEKLLAERLSQSMGNPVDWKWVNAMRSQTIKGNYYWGELKMNVFDNSILNSLLVFQMATRDKTLKNFELARIQNYFLEQRKKYWRNTYESALILEHLLPEVLKNNRTSEKPQLTLTGSVTRTVNTFPFELSARAGDITVTKTGNAPVYFTAYTERWNTAPEKSNNEFVVRTYFENSTNTLRGGKPVTLTIDVEVKKDAEYIMIEVPIPAGCSYQSKTQQRGNGEVHREYFNHKTAIFCKNLKKGKYTYTIELLPRYSGRYTLNPATVECMYFPTLNGREEMKTVVIE